MYKQLDDGIRWTKLSLVKMKKKYAMWLHCIWLAGRLKTTSKDWLFDKILLIGSSIFFSIRFPHHRFALLILLLQIWKDAPQKNLWNKEHSQTKMEKRWKKITMNLSIDRLWWWCGFSSFSASRPVAFRTRCTYCMCVNALKIWDWSNNTSNE